MRFDPCLHIPLVIDANDEHTHVAESEPSIWIPAWSVLCKKMFLCMRLCILG